MQRSVRSLGLGKRQESRKEPAGGNMEMEKSVEKENGKEASM